MLQWNRRMQVKNKGTNEGNKSTVQNDVVLVRVKMETSNVRKIIWEPSNVTKVQSH